MQASTRNEEARSYSEFQPIEELNRDDAEITLFFLAANNVLYTKAVNDPWFSAHRSAGNFTSVSQEGVAQLFYADEPATVLACANQEQFCRPGSKSHRSDGGGEPICEPLMDGYDHGASVQSLWSDDEKMQRYMGWTYDSYVLNSRSIRTIVRDLGIASLTTRFGLQNGVQGPLPDNQWQNEVKNWFETSLANLQRLFVEVAHGPSDDRLEGWLIRPNSTEEHELCRNQAGTPSWCFPYLHIQTNPQPRSLESKKTHIHLLQRPRPISRPRHRRHNHHSRVLARAVDPLVSAA